MNDIPDAPLSLTTGHQDLGKRLDRFLAEQCHGTSRAQVQLLIRNRLVSVDGRPAKASTLLRGGQTVIAELGRLDTLKPANVVAEDIPLDVLYEDDDVIAINKPAGMVVHPAKGHWSGTLTAALVWRFGQLSSLGGNHRPGIVHRLDRDTSGVILVARNDRAHTALMRQFERRTVEKTYIGMVSPPPDRDRDQIDAAIGHHPWQREKMAIRNDDVRSKPAQSFYEVEQRQGRFARVRVKPATGRTHQIRVHLAHIGCPILADRLYSGRARITRDWVRNGQDGGEVLLQRQALHAHCISFAHPVSGESLTLSAPLPEDMQRLWQTIEELA